jgi:hypothetical protein
MQDFTLTTYRKLLHNLYANGYSFQTLQDYTKQTEDKVVILRHDVDRLPENAFVIAKIEKEAGIKASYYFRIVKESYDENIIRQIAEMGHEIGYHYENLTTCGGDLRLSIDDFRLNLEKLRKFYPVKTICMHGSPLSKFDNRLLWDKYDYRDFGIIAEPSFDIDYNEVFYLTDTGRSWNNYKASVRDKVNSNFDITIKDTNHLIDKIQNNKLPDKIMINVHPQRWNDKYIPWFNELIKQSVKNVIKRYLLKFRD